MAQREIKFRAWDGEDMLINIDCHNLQEVRLGVFQVGSEATDQVRVIVMQFTGLKDKEGHEIYEGDIVIGSEGLKMTGAPSERISMKPRKVVFHEGQYRLKAGRRSRSYHLRSSIIRQNGLCVIGNIYENPELLEP